MGNKKNSPNTCHQKSSCVGLSKICEVFVVASFNTVHSFVPCVCESNHCPVSYVNKVEFKGRKRYVALFLNISEFAIHRCRSKVILWSSSISNALDF